MDAAADVDRLVAAAARGEQAAWDALVDRYAALVWAVTRAHRLDRPDAADVVQTVWLRLLEHLDRLREPAALAGWLRTTTRHECLRVQRRREREVPDPFLAYDALSDATDSPELALLDNERDRQVWTALQQLSERCRTLLRVISADPDASYAQVSAAAGMPVGSIGPSRARCLEQLRRGLVASGYLVVSGGAA
ncbi:MAG TPA: sigma-70 family RNA polymerase sigma factor [Sporichthyaceae bacterium]|nr:sigma-70 family RNA polymerase sigma factor [Sporichthyaceae bacterium]